MKKILAVLMLSVMTFLYGCATPMNQPEENFSILREGLWVGEIEFNDEKTVWYDRYYPNGDLVIIFETYVEGKLVNKKIEFCKSEIINGVEHVSTLQVYENGKTRRPPTETHTYEEYYEILELSNKRRTYKDLNTGIVYESQKIFGQP